MDDKDNKQKVTSYRLRNMSTLNVHITCYESRKSNPCSLAIKRLETKKENRGRRWIMPHTNQCCHIPHNFFFFWFSKFPTAIPESK